MQNQDHSGTAFWSQSSREVLAGLNSTFQGLNSAQAQQSLEKYGPNVLKARKKATPLKIFLNQFNSPILYILLFATGVSAFLKDWVDAVIILVIILGSAILSFIQEYSANAAAEKLRAQISIQASVLRDGKAQDIPVEMVVPGDVVLLSAGSLIPADGLVLESDDFFVNQAALTGETYPVEKIPGIVPAQASLVERNNCVFMGTHVSSGSARALMVQTGTLTAFGQIAQHLTLRPPETEFERGIRRFGYLLTEVTLLLVLAVFAINVFFQKPVLDSLLFSIALAVGLTPQLLPAIININLSKGSQAMAARGVIVRRLASIENFGSMDILCTDKTGTLTAGVVRLDGALGVDGKPSEQVYQSAFYNAYFQTGLVNPLDQAILSYAQPTPELKETRKVDEIPYDFTRKRLSVIVQIGQEYRMITKGAFNQILDICTDFQQEGQVRPLDDDLRRRVEQLFTDWSTQGYRVLAVATRSVPPRKVYPHEIETEMTLLGFLLFFDPPKPGVKEALAELAGLGIELKIITGDNKLAALHTAEAVGLKVTGVLTGAEIRQLSDQAFWYQAEKTSLFVEVDPNQKEQIILALRKKGHVIGYMGDGINDAPSLHVADVGISVDQAVDVAKEAADFVLMKQDLAVLSQGVMEGRRTFANSLKYVFMATSANFGNMFSVAGASLFLPFLPMLPKQILLINFLTDLPEMTIATDHVDEALVKRPRRWDIRFIRRFMVVFGLLSSVFDFVTFAILLGLLRLGGIPAGLEQRIFHTGWFIESVLSAALVVFAIRTRLPFQRSRPSLAMVAATGLVFLLTLALPYSPLSNLLEFTSLPALLLVAMILVVLVYFGMAEAVKRWFYAHQP